ncbi:uncharacterized protein [Rutidosis leptorrhynchoides]|uniref:uncharacterized protein n=1 Tax=Rutidosis leptorrhynchoides TaxID=125765 RepID=UPI003A990FA1
MERQDWIMIGADCVVLSCCCQCLILQILFFLLLKLPRKVYRKTKEYFKRKFNKQKKVAITRCAAAFIGRQKRRQSPYRVVDDSLRWEEVDGCMEEVEKVLGEMCNKGEFGFGSFWKGDDNYLEDNCRLCFVNQQLGYHDHDGNYHLIPVFGPLTMKLR